MYDGLRIVSGGSFGSSGVEHSGFATEPVVCYFRIYVSKLHNIKLLNLSIPFNTYMSLKGMWQMYANLKDKKLYYSWRRVALLVAPRKTLLLQFQM